MACLAALALAPAASTRSAESPPSQPQRAMQADEELDEVRIKGRRDRQTDPQQSFNWLARLVGDYTIDGHVTPRPGTPDDSREVRGQARCIGFGIAPGVVCEMKVRWPAEKLPGSDGIPGDVSTLDPAVMLFGFDIGEQVRADDYTIPYMLIDNKGSAEGGTGYRVGDDTVTFRSPCATDSRQCQRTMTMTADSSLEKVTMRIEIMIKGVDATRYDFVMHRVPDSDAVVYGRRQEKSP